MITSAKVECRDQVAILSKDGKSFKLQIEAPSDAHFTMQFAKRNFDTEKPIKGYTLLQLSVSGRSTQVIKVLLSGK